MRKVIVVFVGLLALVNLNQGIAQNHPLILGVETFGNWDSTAAGEVPRFWDAFNREIVIMGNNYGNVVCVKKDSADPQDSDYSVRISNQIVMNNSVVAGLLTTAKLNIDFLNQSGGATGGVPYIQKPAQLKGWYKFVSTVTDTANISIWFTNDTNKIGKGSLNIYQKKTIWTLFTVDINYQTAMNPDTMNIMFTSSIAKNNVPLGTILEIDHIWFEGGSLGVNKAQNVVDEFKVFPNPCQNIVNIMAPMEAHKFDVNIYNSVGKIVKSFKGNNQAVSFNSQSLGSGVYFVEILYENRRKMQQLIIQ